jgi:hypothetical protein
LTLKLVHRPRGGQVVLLEEKDGYLALLSQRFGPRFKKYRQNWARAEERRYLGSFPLSLDLALNSGCQLNCLMCPLKSRPEKLKRLFWLPGQYRRLLAEAKEHSLPALTLGLGCEPLLDPQTPQRIKEAVRAGIMDIRLGTNGLLLTEKTIGPLIDSGLTRLEISVDAVKAETYKAIRGGDLNRLEKMIDLFLNQRSGQKTVWPLLRVSFLKLPQNKGELKQFFKRWQGRADLISIQKPIWFPGSGLTKPGPGKIKTVPCGQPWQRLGLDFKTQAWPCCSWYGEELLGLNFKYFSVYKIWTSKKMTALRQDLLLNKPPEACLTCAWAGAF